VVPACRPAGTPKAVPERDAEQSVTPDDVALLAHELRRRIAAMRVLGEAVSLLRSQDRDPSAMLERLMGELHDLDDRQVNEFLFAALDEYLGSEAIVGELLNRKD